MHIRRWSKYQPKHVDKDYGSVCTSSAAEPTTASTKTKPGPNTPAGAHVASNQFKFALAVAVALAAFSESDFAN